MYVQLLILTPHVYGSRAEPSVVIGSDCNVVDVIVLHTSVSETTSNIYTTETAVVHVIVPYPDSLE